MTYGDLENGELRCTSCETPVHPLETFPGGICLSCYRPTGEALHRTMTAEKLTKMWGG
jgi:hypothetical protein